MSALRSKDHELFCDTIVKTGLSAFDDKRYLLNATHSLAYGHCLLDNFGIRILGNGDDGETSNRSAGRDKAQS